MMNKFRYPRFVVTILLVLLLSAVSAGTALADDASPPVETQEETSPPETQEETPPVEEITEVTEPPQTEPEALQPSEEVASVPEEETLPVDLPADTSIVVLDENGETVPLATEEAAEIIESSDPQWCPVGVAPGGAGCSGVKTSFNGGSAVTNLIAWLIANQPNKAGVIWIEATYDSGTAGELGPVVLDGLDYTSMDNFALTINGGWTGSGTTLNPNTPSTFNDSFQIINWNNAVTINNILITGASGTGIHALEVQTTGNITVNNVDVQNNTADAGGAFLHNDAGMGNVVINDSTFNENVSDGLTVYSNGTITGKNLSALGNDSEGAILDNGTASSAKAVTLTGSNTFSYNGYGGLTIYSLGAITLSNVTASYNAGGSGAYIDNCDFDTSDYYCDVTSAAGVTLKGSSTFNNNGWDGLRVWSGGAITVNNLTANDNGTDAGRPGAEDDDGFPDFSFNNAYGKGAYLHNYGAYTPKALTLTGTNTFNGNASAGLFAFGWGALKVNNLTANNNGNDCDPVPTHEDESLCDGARLDGAGVTLTGYGIFENNYDDGLEAHSWGAITLNNLYAESNGWNGVLTNSYGPKAAVTLAGVNIFNYNSDTGLYVISEGAVTLNNLTANENGAGVYVDNASKYDFNLSAYVNALKPVTLKGISTFNANVGNGLEIHSSGVITTSGVTASGNGGDGAYLDNCLYDTSDCTGSPNKAITMNGTNTLSYNSGAGLIIESLGAIKVNNLTAEDNTAVGTVLDNEWTFAVGGVTVTGFANVSYNGNTGGDDGDTGLYVGSTAAISLANVTANGNGLFGVEISNDFNPAKPANVTLTGNNIFNYNFNNGLWINTYGIVTTNNLTALYNGAPADINNPSPFGAGVVIENSGGTSAKAVTLNGVNIFNGNYDYGLFITSLGAIKVNKVTANYNGAYGAYLDNLEDLFNSAITLVGYGIFNENGASGFVSYSNGAVTIANMVANFNGNQGAEIYNYNNTTPTSFVNVTLTGINTFNGNIKGLSVISDGIITLNNITADANADLGATLNNATGTLKNIVLNGVNSFSNNVETGLVFSTSGSAILTRVNASMNNNGGSAGAPNGISGTAAGSITLTCGSLYGNEGYGYDLVAGTTITLKGVFSYGNGLTPDNAAPAAIITRTCPLP